MRKAPMLIIALIFIPWISCCSGIGPVSGPVPSPESTDVYYHRAESYLEEVSKTDPNSVSLISQRSRWAKRKKNFGYAESLLRKAISENDRAELRLELGNLLFEHGRYDEACGEFQAVLSKGPRNHRALIGLAKSKQAAGKTGEALSLLDSAISIDPGWHLPHVIKAEIFLESGCTPGEDSGWVFLNPRSIASALKEYALGLEIYPEYEDVLFTVYHICLALRDSDREKIKDILDGMQKSDGIDFVLALLRGGGDPANCYKNLKKLKGKQSKKMAGTLLALLERNRSGEDSFSRSEFINLLKCQSLYDEAFLFTLAKIHFMTRDFPSAERELKILIKKMDRQEHPSLPETQQPRIWLARVYMIQERYPEAAELLEQVNKILIEKIGKAPGEDVSDLFGMVIGTFPYNSEDLPGKGESIPPVRGWKVEGYDKSPLEVQNLALRIRRANFSLENGNLPEVSKILEEIINTMGSIPKKKERRK
ncbi:MAG: tetratricopeptide repeat protein [Candidatus Eremiobacteraeota bacterium]|nr:tetratricopeptide repeat protein [Candidatus Eremiobacteraeota bacterium]